MELTFEQIKSAATGAVGVTQTWEGIVFERFTREQADLYRRFDEQRGKQSALRCEAAAGIRLRFKTDSRKMLLKLKMERCTSRMFYSVDVFVNGTPVGYLDNFSDITLPRDYTVCQLPLGKNAKEFELGAGEKEVCIYLPWSVRPVLEALMLDDGAYMEPVKPARKLLAYGDSITQGYDALRPSNRYIAQLTDRLGAEEINKAIGGEFYWEPLAQLKDDLSPHYITVAYGTNDWSMKTQTEFQKECRGFYRTLSENYPNARIFAITPIWRADHSGERKFGDFHAVESGIREAVKDLKNVTVLSGFAYVPHDRAYFADLRLHPNDNGFAYYAENLYQQIKKHLEQEEQQ